MFIHRASAAPKTAELRANSNRPGHASFRAKISLRHLVVARSLSCGQSSP